MRVDYGRTCVYPTRSSESESLSYLLVTNQVFPTHIFGKSLHGKNQVFCISLPSPVKRKPIAVIDNHIEADQSTYLY